MKWTRIVIIGLPFMLSIPWAIASELLNLTGWMWFIGLIPVGIVYFILADRIEKRAKVMVAKPE